MLELTNRELATIIWLAVLVAIFVLVPSLRRAIGPQFAGVLRAFFVWPLILSLLAYFGYAVGIVYLAWKIGLWNPDQLKDALFIVTFVGVPLLLSAHRVKEGARLVRTTVRGAVGVSALVAFYFGLASLPLIGELILQPFLTVLILMATFAQGKSEFRQVVQVIDGLLGLVGLALAIYVTWHIATTWDGSDLSDAVDSLILAICLAVALVPFVYVFAFAMLCESILNVSPRFNDNTKPSLRVRLACIWGFHISTRLAAEFVGSWRREVARASGFRDAVQVMRTFREAVKERDRAAVAHKTRLHEMTGVKGVDAHGLVLDRREFAATKEVLTNLFFMQMGWYRNRGDRYRPELLEILGSVASKGLPEDHGIQLMVRKDGQAWRAWRQTPGGWYFGVGGTSALEHQWQYAGTSPPSGFLSKSSSGWVNATISESSPEWRHNDEPPILG